MTSDPPGMHVCVIDLNGTFGPLNSYCALIDPLAALGWTHTFVVPDEAANSLRSRFENIEIYTTGPLARRGRDWRIARIVRRVASAGTMVVHANTTSAARAGILAAASRRAPIVVHLRNSKLSRGERLFVNALAWSPTMVRFVAVSPAAANLAGRRVRGAARVVPNAVAAVPPRDLRPPAAPARVGVVANQQPTKGFDVVVDLVNATSCLDVRFDVFGSIGREPQNDFAATARSRLRDGGLEDRVRFHGVVPDLHGRICELDIMLITSRRESFSRVAVEAMSAHVPLVAPRIPGLLETVGGGRFAALYEVADARDAARALHETLDNYDLALKVATEARLWVSEVFDPVAVAAKLDLIYRSMTTRT